MFLLFSNLWLTELRAERSNPENLKIRVLSFDGKLNYIESWRSKMIVSTEWFLFYPLSVIMHPGYRLFTLYRRDRGYSREKNYPLAVPHEKQLAVARRSCYAMHTPYRYSFCLEYLLHCMWIANRLVHVVGRAAGRKNGTQLAEDAEPSPSLERRKMLTKRLSLRITWCYYTVINQRQYNNTQSHGNCQWIFMLLRCVYTHMQGRRCLCLPLVQDRGAAGKERAECVLSDFARTTVRQEKQRR